jgi:hypothetical protein
MQPHAQPLGRRSLRCTAGLRSADTLNLKEAKALLDELHA